MEVVFRGLVLFTIMLIIYIVVIVINYFKKIAKAELKKNNLQEFDSALDILDKITFAIVAATEQTIAKQLRVEVKNGEAPRNSLIYVAREVFESVIENIKPEIKEILESQIDFERYLKKLIEAKVLQVKS